MSTEKEAQRNKVMVDVGAEQPKNRQTAEEYPSVGRDAWSMEDFAPLFENSEIELFLAQWQEIQSRFVDDPNDAVKAADELVANVIKVITITFGDKQMDLEDQWKRSDKVSTEDLRITLKRYHSFFNQLLSLKS